VGHSKVPKGLKKGREKKKNGRHLLESWGNKPHVSLLKINSKYWWSGLSKGYRRVFEGICGQLASVFLPAYKAEKSFGNNREGGS